MITSKNISASILTQLPGAVYVKQVTSTGSRYLWANQYAANIWGISDPSKLIGLWDSEIKRASKQFFSEFYNYDVHVVKNRPLICLNVFEYANNNIKALLVHKHPYKNSHGENYGVICHAIPFGMNQLVAICGDYIFNDKGHLQQGVHLFDDYNKILNLSPRESEVYYHFLRGGSAKRIANRMRLQPRTVEKHLERIKLKINATNKEQLYEFALQNKLLKIIPIHFIQELL